MFGIEHYPLFVLSGVLLNITPGQDTFYVVGRSVAQGREAGVVSALGIGTGTLIHTLLATLGLSAVLAASSLAFGIVKMLGAGYLIWIGIGFLHGGGQGAPDDSTDPSCPGSSAPAQTRPSRPCSSWG